MRRTLVTLVALALSLGAASASLAQNYDGYRSERTPRVTHRQFNQDSRILEGERSGQLTRGEVAQLERGQMRIERMKERARMDGDVSAAERARITMAQNAQNVKIWELKHNNRRSYPAY
jgi:hypothetical protein